MTAIMALAFLYFLVAQNRWSWHLIGCSRDELLDEALPQPSPAGMPWDWHRRPAAAAAKQRRSSSSSLGLTDDLPAP